VQNFRRSDLYGLPFTSTDYWKLKVRIVLQAVNGRLCISDALIAWDQRLPSFLATVLSFFESTRPNPMSSSSRSSSTWAASCRNSKEFIVTCESTSET